jgi:hypothetical protein
MDSELTVPYLSVNGSKEIPRRHRHSPVFSDTEMARVNNSECAGITGNTPNDFGFD